jgi:TRAP-type C4-dicarboxylate transport system permease large subunit
MTAKQNNETDMFAFLISFSVSAIILLVVLAIAVAGCILILELFWAILYPIIGPIARVLGIPRLWFDLIVSIIAVVLYLRNCDRQEKRLPHQLSNES